MRSACLLGIATILAASSLVAHADTIDDFVITGINNPTLITFSLPANPQNGVVSIGAGGSDGGFVISTPLSFNGQPAEGDIQFISNNLYPGSTGINISSTLGPLVAQGSLLYSGLSSDPTFLIGTFDESEYDWASPDPFDKLLYTVTITPEAATPEPSTLILLATGLAGIAGSVRRRSLRQ